MAAGPPHLLLLLLALFGLVVSRRADQLGVSKHSYRRRGGGGAVKLGMDVTERELTIELGVRWLVEGMVFIALMR